MRDDSATWMDLKFKVEGSLLLHLELRGYRSDKDMSIQLNYINDALVLGLADLLCVPSVVITVFQGWRVVAISFEVGGRLYACSDGGTVIALDYPLCHFEIRMTAVASADSFGWDADRLEMRFVSAGDKLDLACSSVSAPASWLMVSRVSGPTLVKNSDWCRRRYARIEGPDQIMQLSQLAGIHAHWTAAMQADSIAECGPRVGAIAVDSHELTPPPHLRIPALQAGESDRPCGCPSLAVPRPRTGESDDDLAAGDGWNLLLSPCLDRPEVFVP